MKLEADCDPHEAFLRVWSVSYRAGSAKDRKSQSSLKIEVGACPLYSRITQTKGTCTFKLRG